MIKVNLEKKEQETELGQDNLKGKVFLGAKWDSPDDLDLHTHVEYKNGRKEEIYYSHKNGLDGLVVLDQDAGVGGRVSKGGNQETMSFKDLHRIKRLLISINYFDGRKLKKTKPSITMNFFDKEINIRLDKTAGDGKALALVYIYEDENGQYRIKNVSKFSEEVMNLSTYDRYAGLQQKADKAVEAIAETGQVVKETGKGLFGKVKSFFS